LKQDELEDAEGFYRRLLEFQGRLPSQDDCDITNILHSLSSVLDKQQKVQITESFYRRLLECHNTIHGSDQAFAKLSSKLPSMKMLGKTDVGPVSPSPERERSMRVTILQSNSAEVTEI
jgi:hypothetical protein